MNPYKQLARSRLTVDEVINGQTRCIGHFFDAVNMRTVTVDLGVVYCTLPRFYRAASSTASTLEAVKPFEGDGAALCEEFSFSEYRPERSEDGTEEGENSPGTYVIPGQTPTGGNNAQKIVNKSSFEWSLERCAAELC